MIRRIVAAGTTALLIGALLVTGATPASAAAKPNVSADGTVRCGAPSSGKATIKPGFTFSPGVGPRTTKSTMTFACTGTTFNSIVTPISAKVVTKSVTPTSSTTCNDLQTVSESPTVSTVDIKWKANGGKIKPTHIVFSTRQSAVPANGSTIPGPTGRSTITGSYAGESAISKVVTTDSTSTLLAACQGKGIKKLNFGGASSLVINEAPIPASGRYSTQVHDTWNKYAGIQYTTAVDYTGATIPLLLDVYTPPASAPSPRPTIVQIHGGAFVGGSRTDMVGVSQYWAVRGYNVVAIDYRLDQRLRQDSSPPKVAGAAGLATADAESAVRWIKAHAATYGFDVNRIAAVGYSAGGAIALGMSAAPDAVPGGTDPGYSSKIQAAVSTGAYLTPGLDLGLVHLVPGLAPILMFHYETDVASNTGPYAFRTCTAYRVATVSCEYVSQPGEGHTTDLTPGSVWWANEVGPFIFRSLHLS